MGKDWKNTGMLTVNQRAERDSDPPLSGSLDIDGKDHWLNGWVSEDKSQIDLEFTPKGVRDAAKGKGNLKRTDKSDKSEKYPDYKGTIKTAKGQEQQIAGWKKQPTGKIELPWISLSINQGRAPNRERTSAPEDHGPAEGEDVSIPF